MMRNFFKLIRDTKGATAIEYGLLAALIAVAAITGMKALGSNLNTKFNNIAGNISTGK